LNLLFVVLPSFVINARLDEDGLVPKKYL
jgi:hypothetical protein